MTGIIENNRVELAGIIVENFVFDHKICGEKFYKSHLCTFRLSGTPDTIPIMVSNRLVDVSGEWEGKSVTLHGQFRSYNCHKNGENHLILYAFAREFELLPDNLDAFENKIYLDGHLCKNPVYRTSPLGKTITDLLIAVNRSYGKSDYIPVICWGRNARYSQNFEVGSHVTIEGRIQSREYHKRLPDGNPEERIRIAYEVSCTKVEVIEDEQKQDYGSLIENGDSGECERISVHS